MFNLSSFLKIFLAAHLLFMQAAQAQPSDFFIKKYLEIADYYQLMSGDGWYSQMGTILKKESILSADEEDFLAKVCVALWLRRTGQESASIFNGLNEIPNAESDKIAHYLASHNCKLLRDKSLKRAVLQEMLSIFGHYFRVNTNLDAVSLTISEQRIFSLIAQEYDASLDDELQEAYHNWQKDRLRMSDA